MTTQTNSTKVLIVGSGPAGYTAAIYASRAGLAPVLYDGMLPGGQLTQTTVVENYPGFPEGKTGFELMDDMRNQAQKFGTDMRFGSVTGVDFSSRPFKVSIDDGTSIEAETIIIATGASAKYLGLPDEQKYAGAGVSACATCDGFFYRGKDVAVVGGGDTACEEASYLAGLAQHVYLIVRRDVLRASVAMQERVLNNPKITVLFRHETLGLEGEGKVERAILIKDKGLDTEERVSINISGFFLAIGHTPCTASFPEIETDEHGYIVTHNGQSTNIEGVFACGDVCDPTYRQAITAAASGCKAAIDAKNYLLAKA